MATEESIVRPRKQSMREAAEEYEEELKRNREEYAASLDARAAKKDQVTPFDVERARLEYLDSLKDLHDRALQPFDRTPDSHHKFTEILRLTYEALQRRLAEQQQEEQRDEASRVIASNTHLAVRQAHYAKIVMRAVIAQVVIAAIGLVASAIGVAVAWAQYRHRTPVAVTVQMAAPQPPTAKK